MEPPAKRPRLAGDTPGDASQLTETSQSSFKAGRDFVIQIDKRPSTNTEADKRQKLLASLQFEQMDTREWSIKKAHAQTCMWFLKTLAYVN
ncbi:hypothetical protein GGR58DRAFT_503163 [Xylaria digitata]|nr:hypothetical protein GGR58DRAFT_503163 [Xylaria digitata]